VHTIHEEEQRFDRAAVRELVPSVDARLELAVRLAQHEVDDALLAHVALAALAASGTRLVAAVICTRSCDRICTIVPRGTLPYLSSFTAAVGTARAPLSIMPCATSARSNPFCPRSPPWICGSR
jgi:hypothetical protein